MTENPTERDARLLKYRYTGKLTPRLLEAAQDLVRNGAPPRVALRRLKITPQTIYNWEKWAETGEKGPKYAAFLRGLEEAWAEWQSFVAGTLPKHVQRDARIAADIAGRIMPDDYGRKDEQQVTFELGPALLAQLCKQASSGQLDSSYVEGKYQLEGGNDVQGPGEAEAGEA